MPRLTDTQHMQYAIWMYVQYSADCWLLTADCWRVEELNINSSQQIDQVWSMIDWGRFKSRLTQPQRFCRLVNCLVPGMIITDWARTLPSPPRKSQVMATMKRKSVRKNPRSKSFVVPHRSSRGARVSHCSNLWAFRYMYAVRSQNSRTRAKLDNMQI